MSPEYNKSPELSSNRLSVQTTLGSECDMSMSKAKKPLAVDTVANVANNFAATFNIKIATKYK
jgi:hypothetical protein